MSKMKRLYALLLSLLLMFSLMLSGCGEGQKSNETDPAQSAEAAYKVTVVDGLGNPYTEKIIVKLIQNGAQVAMGAINKEGIFEKVLPRGDYSVEIASTNSDLECYYLPASVTKDVTETQVIMAYAPTEFRTLNANSVFSGENISYEAGNVTVGSSYIELDAEDRTYALFTPTEAGTYEFSVSNDDASIGYYGAPHFVQSNNVADMDGNKFTLSITADMISSGSTGTSILVIGLDAAEGKEGCILNIERIGDPAWTIEQEPWNNYQPEIPVQDFTLESGVKLVSFDVTAPTDTYDLVLNEADGTYHLGSVDGPKVYVQLGEAVYGICMKDMVGEIVYDADGVLIATGTAPFRYMYDNGPDDFFKEDYTDVMRQYVTAADKATGVYPLTKDLFYMLPLGIENKGWCREGTVNYLFNSVENLNKEIAWMFLLCYGEGESINPGDTTDPKPGDTTKPGSTPTGPIEEHKDEPIIIGGTLEFKAEVKANHLVYFDLLKVNDTTLTIKNKNAYVIYNGVTYEAKNGVVTVPDLYVQYTNMPVQIAIGNKGTSDATFDVVLSYPAGHMMNPNAMKLGSFTVNAQKNNEQGVYYSWTPTQAGTLTITLDNVTSKSGNVEASITVTVTGADLIPHQVSTGDANGNSVSVEVGAGDSVIINISVLPNEQNRYLAATIDVTASFA